MQADRRRLNGPTGVTSTPVFDTDIDPRPTKRLRQANEHRRIFLRTGVVPSAAGSAYYELQPDQGEQGSHSFNQPVSSLKLSVSVHGPRPLPRNAAFSSNLLLSTHVKFAPFATRTRRGYVRDWSERDVGVRLENALRGVIIAERWPKSAVEVVVTILESDEAGDAGMMTVLAGAVTASGAALVDAGIDCIGLVSGGVAGVAENQVVIDPVAYEQELRALCYVAYIPSTNMITDCWEINKGASFEQGIAAIDQACESAKLEQSVMVEAVREAVEAREARFKAG